MKNEAFEALGEQLRTDLAAHADANPASVARVRRELLSRLTARQSGSKRPHIFAIGALVLTTAAAAAALLVWRSPATQQQPLSFWVEEKSGSVDEWVTARDAEQSLRFSDGSSVVAEPHTTTRVMHLSPDGAQLTLERGELDAHVIHRENSRWQVAAGPFVVHVTGTRFHVRWDPQTEKATVSVSEGRVEVTGGNQPLHVLTAGSALELSASTLPASSAAPTPRAATEAEPAAEPARDEDELIRPRSKAEHKPDFRELSTEGHYREALALVEQAGFGQQCEALSARDLLTLGSTARLAGRSDRAREAYLAARRRFPRSAEASISAFSLGRLASDSGHASDAKGWFQRYLSEQPSGPLAREAAGRLIEALRQAGSTAEAKAASESYLKRYPSGPHAALAQSVLAH